MTTFLVFTSCEKQKIKKKGCSDPPIYEVLDELNVIFEDSIPCIIALPNVFTPNFDGINDQLGIITSCGLDSYSIEVRKGTTSVFKSNSVTERWDGVHNGVVQSGVMKYTITINFRGETSTYEGRVISLITDNGVNDGEEYTINDCDKCLMESQFSINGFDSNLPNGEADMCSD